MKRLRLVTSALNSMNWIPEIKLYNISGLNDEMIIEFQALNPQLQSFNVLECNLLSSSILHGIATRLPNLVELQFAFRFDNDKIALQRKFEADVMHLSGLQHLKRLDGVPSYISHRMSTCPIIDALAVNNIPIEDLTVDGFNPCIVESLAKLKNIRKLIFSECSQEMAIDLVGKLPSLEDLRLHGCTDISLNGIKEILELGTNLKELNVFERTSLVDSKDSINSILNLARGVFIFKYFQRSRFG